MSFEIQLFVPAWARFARPILGGSLVVISGVVSPLICIVTLLITPFISKYALSARKPKSYHSHGK